MASSPKKEAQRSCKPKSALASQNRPLREHRSNRSSGRYGDYKKGLIPHRTCVFGDSDKNSKGKKGCSFVAHQKPAHLRHRGDSEAPRHKPFPSSTKLLLLDYFGGIHRPNPW